jgi:uncharacterized membrane protein YphA (DoxX/SURF4 family)
MLRSLLVTDDSKVTAILRLVLGVVFFAHGAQKLLGWFGGPGFSGSMGMCQRRRATGPFWEDHLSPSLSL